VAQRTILWYTKEHDKPIIRRKPKKTFRNPIIQAREIALEIQLKELTQGQMAKKLGCSLSRVSQMLHLLKLPEERQREIEALGDHWERRVVTERGLRKKVKVQLIEQ
jgi:ParB-like chromosome segregation protein Spo0J